MRGVVAVAMLSGLPPLALVACQPRDWFTEPHDDNMANLPMLDIEPDQTTTPVILHVQVYGFEGSSLCLSVLTTSGTFQSIDTGTAGDHACRSITLPEGGSYDYPVVFAHSVPSSESPPVLFAALSPGDCYVVPADAAAAPSSALASMCGAAAPQKVVAWPPNTPTIMVEAGGAEATADAPSNDANDGEAGQ
jgi:hypothetical protein